jgi:succinate dehydrogenase / fumarate reductase, cytochrome b subunit
MNHKFCYIKSTIGQKQLVAFTGLGLALFVLSHMLGNLLMFKSAQAYNEYGHALVNNPLIYVAEAGLIAAFVAHAVIAIRLQILNRRARPERYAVSAFGEKATDKASQTMAIQGLIILVFVVLHIRTFKYGPVYSVDYGNGPIRDLHRLIVEVFQAPGYVTWYILALLVLGLHLSHGIKSVLQTFGAHHPSYQLKIKWAACAYAMVVAGGFIAQPIYMFFFYRG